MLSRLLENTKTLRCPAYQTNKSRKYKTLNLNFKPSTSLGVPGHVTGQRRSLMTHEALLPQSVAIKLALATIEGPCTMKLL